MSTLLIVAWCTSGIGTLTTGLAPLLLIAAAGQAVAGFGNGLENIAADTLIQRAVPREMLGRVFGLVSTPFRSTVDVDWVRIGFVVCGGKVGN